MKLNRKFLLLLLIPGVLIVSCGGASSEEPLTEQDILMTFSVGTMVSGFFATQTALVPPTMANTNTPLPTNTFLPTPTVINPPLPLATWTPVPIYYSSTPNLTLIPTVTGTPPTATSNAGALAFGCNNAAFVRDANYPPGTTVSAGESFVKTWKVENNGSCEWTYNYTLAIVKDDDFDSSWGRLGRNVRPGEWAEVSVIVDAPKHAGTYTGYWRMADASGNAFGATLTLTIVVP